MTTIAVTAIFICVLLVLLFLTVIMIVGEEDSTKRAFGAVIFMLVSTGLGVLCGSNWAYGIARSASSMPADVYYRFLGSVTDSPASTSRVLLQYADGAVRLVEFPYSVNLSNGTICKVVITRDAEYRLEPVSPLVLETSHQ
jgi:hypothetical protein